MKKTNKKDKVIIIIVIIDIMISLFDLNITSRTYLGV